MWHWHSDIVYLGCHGYLRVASVVMHKPLFAPLCLRVVTQQLDDALLLRQRHASLDQALRPLPLHHPLPRRNPSPGNGCVLGPTRGRELFPQHPVDAAAARRPHAERVEVVEAQDVAQIHQTRSPIRSPYIDVGGRRHLGWRHDGRREV